MRILRSSLTVFLFATLMLTGCRSTGEFGSETDQLVGRSRITFQSMMSDGQYPGLVDLASRAKAIIIAPNIIRAAFLLGGSGGNAVMLVRDESGTWSNPAFYTIGGPGFGLQAGIQSSEVVITVMTERGIKAIMDRRVTLGGDAGLAMGELGKGVNAATAMGMKSDLYAFARSAGLFAGVSLEGSVIYPRNTWNQEAYGQSVSPSNILIERSVQPSSQAIGELVAAMP